MTITVDIRPEVQAELARQAAAHDREPEVYAAGLLEEAVHIPASSAKPGAPAETKDMGELFAPVRGLFVAGELDLSRRASALDWSQCPAVESVPGKVSGAWVFRDTRMPVAAVFENLEDGVTIEELVELYAGLTREQITAVLDFAARSLDAPAHAD